MRITNCLFNAALIVCALAVASPISAEIRTFGKSVKMVRHSNEPLRGHPRSVYQWFRSTKQYFGAFYYNKVDQSGYAVRSLNSMPMALLAARTGCEDLSVSAPEKCSLYATMVPRKATKETMNEAGLGRSAFLDYIDLYKPRLATENGTYGAFAISDMGIHAFGGGFTSKEEAIRSALRNCQALVSKEMASSLRLGRIRPIFAPGVDKCVIIDVTQSD